MALFGGKTRSRKALAQTALSPSAVARVQEDIRLRTIAAYRVAAQERFDEVGLPVYSREGVTR